MSSAAEFRSDAEPASWSKPQFHVELAEVAGPRDTERCDVLEAEHALERILVLTRHSPIGDIAQQYLHDAAVVVRCGLQARRRDLGLQVLEAAP